MSLTPGSPGWYVCEAVLLVMLAAVYTISAWTTYRNAWKQPESPRFAEQLRGGLLKTAFMFGLVFGACYLMNRDVGNALFMGTCLGFGTAIDAGAETLAHWRKRYTSASGEAGAAS